jgi:hypothetical protein
MREITWEGVECGGGEFNGKREENRGDDPPE